MSRLRSKMFFGENGYITNGNEKVYEDAGTKLDEFLEEHQNIEVKKIILQFMNNDEHPSEHAILMLYEEL